MFCKKLRELVGLIFISNCGNGIVGVRLLLLGHDLVTFGHDLLDASTYYSNYSWRMNDRLGWRSDYRIISLTFLAQALKCTNLVIKKCFHIGSNPA
jgi:hypothetical protein